MLGSRANACSIAPTLLGIRNGRHGPKMGIRWNQPTAEPVSSRPRLSASNATSGDCPSLVDLDQLSEVAEAPLPPNQYSSEPVVPNENSFDVRLRVELPPLGGQLRHRSLEACFPHLRADRRLAEEWCVMDFLYRTHKDSFQLTYD